MNIAVYGDGKEKEMLSAAVSALPDCCYRSVDIAAFSDYDGFVAYISKSPPDCVVITKDGADGMEGVIAVKSSLESIPIIWISNDSGFGAQSYRLGCTYFHKKPVSAEILSAAIAKCV